MSGQNPGRYSIVDSMDYAGDFVDFFCSLLKYIFLWKNKAFCRVIGLNSGRDEVSNPFCG